MLKDAFAIILAAGKGTRMDGNVPKALIEVMFKPMIDWVLKACDEAEIKKKFVVVGFKAEEIIAHVKSAAKPIFQKQLNGTAGAMLSCEEILKQSDCSNVLVCNADSPMLDSKTFKKAYQKHVEEKADVTVITAKVLNPEGYGRIVKSENNQLAAIIEEQEANEFEKKIDEINSGAYFFNIKSLLKVLHKIKSKNSKNELYLTDAIELIVKNNEKAIVFNSHNQDICLGANCKADVLKINELMNKRKIESLLNSGVNLISTSGVLISPEVEIKKNTVIHPNTIIYGNSKIGENCKIGPNSLIKNSEIGNCCEINATQISDSSIGDFTSTGPFCQIRPNCKIGCHVKIGNFVEVKNSKVGSGTSIAHLTYVGDSDVGKNVNFGCGVVTVNFDGVEKKRCLIADEAFIGCNTNLIAPVKLGKCAYTGAGSTITENVPDFALAIERGQQINVAHYSKKKLAKRKLKFKDSN